MARRNERALTRTDRQSSHPDHASGEVGELDEVDSSPLIACGEAPKVFELIEATLDAVSLFVGGGVVRDDDLARAFRRDHGLGALVGDHGPQGPAVIGFVGKHRPCRPDRPARQALG